MKRVEIERLLPGIFQRTISYDPETLKGNPLYAFLEVMEGLQAQDEGVVANLAQYFNPYLSPLNFVPYLASWVDLAPILKPTSASELLSDLPIGIGRLRELILAAAFLSEWRGTAKGLICFLETAT